MSGLSRRDSRRSRTQKSSRPSRPSRPSRKSSNYIGYKRRQDNSDSDPSVSPPAYPIANMLSVDAENSQKIREHAHEWKNQLVTTATERIVVHRSEIEKTRKTETLTAGADKQATDKSIKHEKNERLLRYWIMTRDHLNELKPDNSLVHAITLFTIASSIQGLEQTDEISTQQARLFALNNDFDRVYRRLEKIRSDIRHVEKELQASEHKMMRRFKRCLDYNTTFEAFKEDEQ